MPDIYILPEKQGMSINERETILDCSLRHGVPLTHVCGGNARCSTCRILILDGLENCLPRNEVERELATMYHFTEDVRLSCQTRLTGPVTAKRLIIDDIDLQILNAVRKSPDSRMGEEKVVSILFADIEGYTEFADKALAFDVIHMLNRYFYRMGELVKDHHGIIMDYFGDGFLAIFGHDDHPDHGFNAISAGMSMLESMEELNAYYIQLFDRIFKIRLGIHTGKVIMGSIGISGMDKLAVIGDAVNVASRIERCNKELETDFLISEAIFKRHSTKLSYSGPYPVSLKGKTGKHNLYRVTGIINST